MPAEITGDTAGPDSLGGEVEHAAGPRQDHNLYSTDFLSVLAEPAHIKERTRVPPPIRRHLSDDALHAPTLLAGGLACILAAGTATAFWIAVGAGLAPPGGKAGLAITNVAQSTQPFTNEGLQVGERAVAPAVLALLSAHRNALPTSNALQALLDASLMRAPTLGQLVITDVAPPTADLVTLAVKKQIRPNEDEAELSPDVVRSSTVQPARVPESPDPPPAFQLRINEGGNDRWSTFTSASIRTASFAGPAEGPKRASDAASAQSAAEDSQPGGQESGQSETADSDVSGASPSAEAKSREAQMDRHRSDAIGPDTRSRNKGAIGGKYGSGDSSGESVGARGHSESAGRNDRGYNGNGSEGDSGRGSGPQGKSNDRDRGEGNSEKSHDDKGKSNGTGPQGKSNDRDRGEGNSEKGDDKGKSSNGNGDNGRADKGKGDRGNGDRGKGDKGKGGKGSRS